jgi:hypothetical protein
MISTVILYFCAENENCEYASSYQNTVKEHVNNHVDIGTVVAGPGDYYCNVCKFFGKSTQPQTHIKASHPTANEPK